MTRHGDISEPAPTGSVRRVDRNTASGYCPDCGSHFEITADQFTVDRFIEWWDSQHNPGHLKRGEEF